MVRKGSCLLEIAMLYPYIMVSWKRLVVILQNSMRSLPQVSFCTLVYEKRSATRYRRGMGGPVIGNPSPQLVTSARFLKRESSLCFWLSYKLFDARFAECLPASELTEIVHKGSRFFDVCRR